MDRIKSQVAKLATVPGIDGTSGPSGSAGATRRARKIPRIGELGAAAVFVVGGLLMLLGGVTLLTFADRAVLTELAAADMLEPSRLSDEVLIELSLALTTWGGWGMVLTGAGMVLGGTWFALATRGEANDRRPSRTASIVLGGAAGILLAFVPFSPALGGGIAGYIGPPGQGLAMGSGAGLLAVLPGLLPGIFLAMGFVVEAPVVEAGPSGTVLGVLLAGGLLLGAVVGIIIGGVGGYIGDRVAGEA
jgi:hypothetical protein